MYGDGLTHAQRAVDLERVDLEAPVQRCDRTT